MMKLTAAAAAALMIASGLAFGATQQPGLESSRGAVASAVASSCASSPSDCVAAVRHWLAAANDCVQQTGETQACVCSREGLNIARGIGDAAFGIKSTNTGLFGMISSTVTETAPGCFAGAFAQIALRVEPDGGAVGSPG